MLETKTLGGNGRRAAVPTVCCRGEHGSGFVENPEDDCARQQRRGVDRDAMRKLTEMREFLAERTIGRIVADRKTIWMIRQRGRRCAGFRHAVPSSREDRSVDMSLNNENLDRQRQKRNPEQKRVRALCANRGLAAIMPRVQTPDMAVFDHRPPRFAPRVLNKS